MDKHLESIMLELRSEREYQQQKWGDEFDRNNTPNDWIAYIMHYAGKGPILKWDKNLFRRSLIQVATICIAAIEWCDRTDGNMPKRHYD